MKKALVILVVLALCVPAMAATVTITDNLDGTGTITVDAVGGNIVGLGLDIDVTVGGNITAAVVDTATFNIHMDAAHDMEEGTPGSYGYGDGTPIANQDAVGEAAVSANFAVSVGALNGESTAGATGSASVSITVTVDGDTTIEVSENALRNGIVLTDGTGEDITNGTAGVVTGTIAGPGGDCFERYYAPGTAQHDLFLSLGSPDCWCSDIHQCGDVNGDCFVTIADDIMPMVVARAGVYDPCADSNYDGFVTIADDIMTAVRHRTPATPPHTDNGGDCLDGTCPTAVGQETDLVCDPQSDGDGEWILDGNDD